MSEWIEWKWTPEKPYPESLYTKIHVEFEDGVQLGPYPVFMWYDEDSDKCNFHEDATQPKIVRYKKD